MLDVLDGGVESALGSGTAASRYEPCWEDWYDSAQRVTAVMSETAKFLNAYLQQEGRNVERVGQVRTNAERM